VDIERGGGDGYNGWKRDHRGLRGGRGIFQELDVKAQEDVKKILKEMGEDEPSG
jgi:hypothetical protein